MDTLLSVDLGTTVCKAALYTITGQLLSSSSLEYPLISPQPEVVEQDAALWWALALRTMAATVEQAGPAGRAVCGIGVSSQGISFVPVSPSGKILRNALCWLDTRAGAESDDIRAQVSDAHLFALTGKRSSAAYTLPKLLWLRAHEPDLYAEAGTFLMAHDYLVYRLCGAQVTDYSLAGGSLLLDLHALAWSDELLGAFDIHATQLPRLAWAGAPAGSLAEPVARLLGLRAGTPVIVGGQDQKCAALAAGIRPGVATVSLGTAAAISVLTDRPVLDPVRRIPTFPFVRPGQYVLEGVVGTAGAALRWARDAFFPDAEYATLDRLAAASPPGARGVQFHPHLAGATSPHWQSAARGSFTGLSLAAARGDLVRSIFEGVAFEIKANLDAICALTTAAGQPEIAEIYLFGGGAASQTWQSILAQVTGRPVSATRTVDMANWGACILAGIGTGKYEDRFDAWLSGDRAAPVVPQPDDIERYASLYAAYVSAGAGE